MEYYCNICKKDITKAEFFYSKNNFDRPLCREHQELERRAKEKSLHFEGQEGAIVKQEPGETNAEEIVDSGELSNEDAQNSSWKSRGKKVVGKMGKGVLKGVKKIVETSKKQLQIRKWRGTILRRMRMSQLKRLCFEQNISTKKTVEKEGEYFDELIEIEVDCSKDDLVSRLKNQAPLDAIISFANRNHIDIREIIEEIERKKKEWGEDELTEIGEERDSRAGEQWRIKVLTRDNFKCRVCGEVGNSAHHIYSRKYCQEHNKPKLEWDTRNGITACYECHKKITIDGRKWFEENEKYFKKG